MRFPCAVAIAITATAASAHSETFEFEAHDGARFVRCTDQFGTAACEVIFEDAAGSYYECVALDDAGEPLAVTTATAGTGAIYTDLDAALIDRVACRNLG